MTFEFGATTIDAYKPVWVAGFEIKGSWHPFRFGSSDTEDRRYYEEYGLKCKKGYVTEIKMALQCQEDEKCFPVVSQICITTNSDSFYLTPDRGVVGNNLVTVRKAALQKLNLIGNQK